MKPNELEIIIRNDKEWRRFILKELSGIQDDQKKMLIEMTTLKVKVAVFSGLISAAVSFIWQRL
jgi:hypothetical protein